ncbi:MAG: TetR/AcrR family transcriptional regulator [Okeania sp. SIO2F4]|uniref:TetR/AcrR family transcriptional regulator n=1 Tax=Okeania sp. SIO2F4 TaxID=2607790 RepID=UPI001429B1C8|nr:TetR/AcrR family transcriptional regulator [Okeania sp. SIO2F4]NES02367.1 TetR/AcrR family transcriptional regulator [Okeania sp. SIO2F4]
MSKEEAIAKLIQVFRQYGYEGTTLTKLSEATGLGKASLYHYFPGGKAEMAATVLEYANSWFETTVLKPLKADTQPEERIKAMSQKINEFYNQGQETCLWAVLSVGEAHDLFNNQIQNILIIWIDTLTQVLIEAGIEAQQARQRSEDAIIQVQGALILARVLNNNASFQRTLARLPKILLGN